MASQRKDIIAPGQIYHVFNRSVERRPVFTNKHEYQRMINLLSYYRYTNLSLRYSQFKNLPEVSRKDKCELLEQRQKFEVVLYAFALMPNHFHMLIKQVTPKGISTYLSNISNSFAKYFNIRHKRTGSLWQRSFKAVRIENDEQMLHVSRYIHLNPVSSYVIKEDELDRYPWTSLPEYLTDLKTGICDTSMIRDHFKTIMAYRSFIHDQVGYAQELEKIKHLSVDGEEV